MRGKVSNEEWDIVDMIDAVMASVPNQEHRISDHCKFDPHLPKP